MYRGAIGSTMFRPVVMELMLLGFILGVEFNSVVTFRRWGLREDKK